jgi:GT2 family glycosyltransferase
MASSGPVLTTMTFAPSTVARAAMEVPSRTSSNVDVSVIVPTYRRKMQVVEAVKSALDQQGPSLEVLVFDDDPNASAREAVRSIDDDRLRYFECAKHSGGRPAVVRNAGAKIARGRYLHFLDDDDILKPRALATLSQCLDENPQVGMAFGGIIPFGDDTEWLRHTQKYYIEATRVLRAIRSSRALVANLLFHPALFINSACMTRREVFAAVGGYDTAMHVCEDTDLWARIARLAGHTYVDQPVLGYRMAAGSLMQSLEKDDERLLSAYRTMHAKYRAQYGLLEFYSLNIWARTTLRLHVAGAPTGFR